MQLCSAGDYHENLPLNSSIWTTNLFKRGRLKRWAPIRLHSYHLRITTLGEMNHLPGILHEIFNTDRDKKCHDARSSITLGYTDGHSANIRSERAVCQLVGML